jgi:hypothetical protein
MPSRRTGEQGFVTNLARVAPFTARTRDTLTAAMRIGVARSSGRQSKPNADTIANHRMIKYHSGIKGMD